MTGEGAAPAGGLELAFRGPSLGLAPSAGPAGRADAGVRSGEGPGLRAAAHPCEPHTCSLEHLAEKHVCSASAGAYPLSGMFPVAIGTRLFVGGGGESSLKPSHGAFGHPGFWPQVVTPCKLHFHPTNSQYPRPAHLTAAAVKQKDLLSVKTDNKSDKNDIY